MKQKSFNLCGLSFKHTIDSIDHESNIGASAIDKGLQIGPKIPVKNIGKFTYTVIN